MALHHHRRLGAATAALVLGVSLAGCAGAPEKDDLEDALLSASDLPDGFEKAEDEEDSENDELFDGTCLADIGQFEDRAGDPDVKAEMEYEEPEKELAASIEVSVSYFEDDIADQFDDVIDDLKKCTKIDVTDDTGLNYDLTIATEDLDVDDADAAAKLTMSGKISYQGQDFPITSTFVVIRKDGYVSNVTTSEFDGTGLADQAEGLAEEQFENVLDLA